MKQKLLGIIGLSALIAVIFLIDFGIASKKISRTEFLLDYPSEAVADGKTSLYVELLVLTDGEPRAGDFVQSWVQAGDAKLLPLYVFLDDEGSCTFKLTPHVLSPYSKNPLVITVYDMSMGAIIEQGKKEEYSIELVKPEDS